MRISNSHATLKRLPLILGVVVILVLVAIIIWLLVKPAPQGGSQANTPPNGNGATHDSAVEAEAKAFVLRFMDVFDQAIATGDFSTMSNMYALECNRCKDMDRTYSKLYRDGGRVEGGGYVNPRLQAAEGLDGLVTVTVESTVPAYKIVYPNGTSKDYPAEANDTATFTVKKGSKGTWLVMEWTYH